MAIFIIVSAILLLVQGQEEEQEVVIEPYIGEVMDSGYTLQ